MPPSAPGPPAEVGSESSEPDPGPTVNSDGRSPRRDDGSAVEDYLAELLPLVEPESDRLEELQTVMEGTYASRQAWLGSIVETTETFRPGDELAERAADLDPPPGYEAAHEAFVASLRQRPSSGEAILTAAARDDVFSLVLELQRFNHGLAEVLLAAPRPMCRELVDLARFFLNHVEFCRDPGTLPDGSYARQTWSVTRELTSEVFPRTSALPPRHLMHEDELVAWNLSVLPSVRQAVGDAGARARRLQPPPELRDDHQALLTFLDDLGDDYDAVIAAAEGGDGRPREGDRIARSFERKLSPAGRELLVLLLVS